MPFRRQAQQFRYYFLIKILFSMRHGRFPLQVKTGISCGKKNVEEVFNNFDVLSNYQRFKLFLKKSWTGFWWTPPLASAQLSSQTFTHENSLPNRRRLMFFGILWKTHNSFYVYLTVCIFASSNFGWRWVQKVFFLEGISIYRSYLKEEAPSFSACLYPSFLMWEVL